MDPIHDRYLPCQLKKASAFPWCALVHGFVILKIVKVGSRMFPLKPPANFWQEREIERLFLFFIPSLLSFLFCIKPRLSSNVCGVFVIQSCWVMRQTFDIKPFPIRWVTTTKDISRSNFQVFSLPPEFSFVCNCLNFRVTVPPDNRDYPCSIRKSLAFYAAAQITHRH